MGHKKLAEEEIDDDKSNKSHEDRRGKMAGLLTHESGEDADDDKEKQDFIERRAQLIEEVHTGVGNIIQKYYGQGTFWKLPKFISDIKKFGLEMKTRYDTMKDMRKEEWLSDENGRLLIFEKDLKVQATDGDYEGMSFCLILNRSLASFRITLEYNAINSHRKMPEIELDFILIGREGNPQ